MEAIQIDFVHLDNLSCSTALAKARYSPRWFLCECVVAAVDAVRRESSTCISADSFVVITHLDLT